MLGDLPHRVSGPRSGCTAAGKSGALNQHAQDVQVCTQHKVFYLAAPEALSILEKGILQNLSPRSIAPHTPLLQSATSAAHLLPPPIVLPPPPPPPPLAACHEHKNRKDKQA